MWLIDLWLPLLITAIILFCLKSNQRPKNFPPGPICLPIIGNLHYFFPSPAKGLHKFQKYGAIAGTKIFSRWGVIINDPTLMRTAFNLDSCSSRIDLILFEVRNEIIAKHQNNKLGIIDTSGDTWREQRRFSLRTLKDLGFGRQMLESVIAAEIQELIQFLERKKTEKIHLDLIFNRSVLNIIWAIVIGQRFEYGDKRFQELISKISKMLRAFNPFHPFFQIRFIRKLFPNLQLFQDTNGVMRDIIEFFKEDVEKRRLLLQTSPPSASYVDIYIDEMNRLNREGKETTLSIQHLMANIMDLFVAGSDTTSSTLTFGLFYIVQCPQVQKRIQEELDEVVGRNNTPGLEHMEKLPYTSACICEIQRMSNLVPFGVPHKTSEEVKLAGYTIPAGTSVTFNLSKCLKSPGLWEKPDEFYPEHFITSEGEVKKPDYFMPFGYGKRICLGERLAHMELFMFFTCLMHRFQWKFSEDSVSWDTHTIVAKPPSFSVYIKDRLREESS